MKTFLRLLVVVPLGLLAVAFALANRQHVEVSFDPFATDVPAFALSGPLFLVIIAVVVIGVIIGSVATWLSQGHHRRVARAARREADDLRADIARLRADLDAQRRESGEVAGHYPLLPDQHAA